MSELLPANTTQLEAYASKTKKKEVDLNVRLNTLINSDHIPDGFLNFLAIQHSVDYWSDFWSPSLKRAVIKQAFDAHKIKGTPAAIKNALKPFGYEVNLVEWFETSPQGQPGTFYLEIELIGKGLSEEVNKEVNRLVDENKPVSRHLSSLKFTSNPILSIKTAVCMQDAISIEILPRNL